MPVSYTNTLRYWFDVEALMYPDLPKPGRRRAYTLRYENSFPWQQTDSLAVDDHKYFAYFGLVQKKILETELFELFRTSPEEDLGGNHSRPKTGKTFLCSIEISAKGIPIVSTLQLAAFAVAFAERKHQKILGCATILESLKDKIKTICAESDTLIANADWFIQVTDFLISELDWQPRELMAKEQIYVHRVPIINSKGKPIQPPPEMNPINSFYLEDIERIRNAAQSGSCSIQVQRYLEGERKISQRVDVTSLNTINTLLASRDFPVGRWPSQFPLFLMQQVAVNTALNTLKNGGLFSVNGPPGTGKTTLLMDVIAARVVERAKLLAKFDDPEKAFSRNPNLITYPPNKLGTSVNGPCFFLDEKLLDFGIVVASANNKAVENITRELPNLTKVSSEFLQFDGEPFNYFAEAAAALVNPDKKKSAPTKLDSSDSPDDTTDANAEEDSDENGEVIQCWGLISAALGKKKNRDRVIDKLGKFSECGIAESLDRTTADKLDWGHARTRFKQAIKRVTDMQLLMEEFDKALLLSHEAEQKLAVLQAAELQAEFQNSQAQSIVQQHTVLLQETESEVEDNLEERKQYAMDWPWWRLLITRLFNTRQYIQVNLRRAELEEEYAALRSQRAESKRSLAQASIHAAKTQADLQVEHAARTAHEKEITHLENKLNALRSTLGIAAFDPKQFQEITAEDQQKTLIRSNPSYHAARAEVFLTAMHLHKAFIKNAGKPFETNFRLALGMLGRETYIQNHFPIMAPHLWATFFLVVPVVSSTFASISRCFCDLQEGQIGLLLVDEAGQAVPSNALGAIWRSKRVLIVGDPLQVEPVITMDTKLDYEILTYHQAPEEHLLTRYSAQHLADRQNRYGAIVTQYDGSELWIGSPLRVHRRCVDPMFSVANEIAYNNKMVFGPRPEEEIEQTVARPLIGPSRWIDIVADDFDEHYSITEANHAFNIVVQYVQQGLIEQVSRLPDLYIISPFKSVAEGICALLKDRLNEWASNVNDEALAKWLDSHVGTVHTFQGKECESVVFVLGGKTAGARSWAATKPNIINVAITRAKRRLYVIGNKRAWCATTFGAALARALN